MSTAGRPPDVRALVERLAHHQVRYVLNGSIAAMVYGVSLIPSDFDLAPDLGVDNLARLARLLVEIGAKPKFVPTWAKGPSREACERWTPEPLTPSQLDHRFATPLGELDVVPSNAGTFVELAPRAIPVEMFSACVQVAHPDDVLAYWHKWGRVKDEPRIARLRELRAGCDPHDIPAGLEARLAVSRPG